MKTLNEKAYAAFFLAADFLAGVFFAVFLALEILVTLFFMAGSYHDDSRLQELGVAHCLQRGQADGMWCGERPRRHDIRPVR